MTPVPSKRTIRPGESLLQLAYEAGFDSWKRLWHHEANEDLRAAREDPQVLLPGDEITVPDPVSTPEERCPVDKEHRFRLTRPRAWVNLRMVDDAGEPLAGARYALTIDRTTHEGLTDDDGMLSVEIQPNVHHGHIQVWFDKDRPPFESSVMVGYLDPASSWSGISGRLSNLGARSLVPRPAAPASNGPASLDPVSEALLKMHDTLTNRHDKRESR